MIEVKSKDLIMIGRSFALVHEKEYDLIELKNCHHCIISACIITDIKIINSQNNTLINNKIGSINITSTPPTYKWFNKRRQRKWCWKYGSVNNVVSGNYITEDEHSKNNTIKIS